MDKYLIFFAGLVVIPFLGLTHRKTRRASVWLLLLAIALGIVVLVRNARR